MGYSEQEHLQFLEEELRAQTDAFRQKLHTKALFLLQEREELFVAQFLKFKEGEMILRFSGKRGLPRHGEYLYCFTVPKELRDYRTWGNSTYGDLLKAKTSFSEAVCIWQAPASEKDFSLVGFRGVDLEFASHIQEAQGMILLLGPNKPPFEYLANLQQVVGNTNSDAVNRLFDQALNPLGGDRIPHPLRHSKNSIDFLLTQLALQDELVIEGPPGTGKTYLIAELCHRLCGEGKTVLVTALTNRALLEIAEKPALRELLAEHRVLKTRLSVDEARLLPDLQNIREITPCPGRLILSTFFFTSGQVPGAGAMPPFDYMIVDEASQALLAMFGCAKRLGQKNIWIGDARQLPPVVALSEDVVRRKGYPAFVDGFKALSSMASVPAFRLRDTYRLTGRGARYTGLFYGGDLWSKAGMDVRLSFPGLPQPLRGLLHPEGGPTLIRVPAGAGEYRPASMLALAPDLVAQLLAAEESLHISVLTYFVETAKALQRTIFRQVGHRKNLLVECVSRVQGLTTDITLFVIPNAGHHRSLERRLFNVATSRARRHTLIIADPAALTYRYLEEEVRQYLHQLNADFSFAVGESLTPSSGLHP